MSLHATDINKNYLIKTTHTLYIKLISFTHVKHIKEMILM